MSAKIFGFLLAICSLFSLSNAILCKDGKSQCPDGTTCCPLSASSSSLSSVIRLFSGEDSGESTAFGCCPMPKAVCCSDHIHCCAHGTTCDLQEGTCRQANGRPIAMSRKLPATAVDDDDDSSTSSSSESVEDEEIEDVVCGHREATCPSGTTCCKLSSGKWGCCPIPNAVCCADHLHCCPSGTTCDIQHGRCNTEDGRFRSMLRKHKAKPLKSVRRLLKKTMCPDGSECPRRSTCCDDGRRGYRCCVGIRKAVCCAHSCCPAGHKCADDGQCQKIGPIGEYLRRLFS